MSNQDLTPCRLGLIGCGNMGGAILAGLLKHRLLPPSQVTVYDKIVPKAKALGRTWKVRVGGDNADVVHRSQIVLLAVKPQDLFEAASELQKAFTSRHLVITILAGTPIAKIRRAVGTKPKIVRAMPNLGATVGEAITALTMGGGAGVKARPASPLQVAERIFSCCGRTVRLPEKYFDLVTALSGSGPAYFFLLMELLAREGKRQGLAEKVAEELAVQTALGAALLARGSKDSPAELREKVTSKGGTTEAALKVFEKEGLPRIVSKGLRAALERGRQLSQ